MPDASANLLFFCCNRPARHYSSWLGSKLEKYTLNAEYCKKALEKVGNPNVLINLVSRRVRQLNSGGGASSRAMLLDTTGLGAADIALLEIIEDKMGWELPPPSEADKPTPSSKKRKKH